MYKCSGFVKSMPKFFELSLFFVVDFFSIFCYEIQKYCSRKTITTFTHINLILGGASVSVAYQRQPDCDPRLVLNCVIMFMTSAVSSHYLILREF